MPSRWLVAVSLAALLAVTMNASAQQLPPRIGYVCPAGGQRGATFEVSVGGQRLDGVDAGYVAGSGVRVEVVELIKPITQQQVNQLRERLKELQPKPPGTAGVPWPAGKTAEITKEIADIRRKLAGFLARPSPAIAETAKLRITISPEAAPGDRELRLATPLGVSNPMLFCVGQLPEFTKSLPKTPDAPRDLQAFRSGNDPRIGATTPAMAVTLPIVVNGQILPGGADRYRFQARKGQRLVIAARARELIPYIADAVPGWFQAVLTLYDAKGNELAYSDHFRFHPDPVICHDIAADGEYVLEVRDSLYRGREDFVYRVSIGELPLVMGIFPLGGKAGEQTTVELQGWNLPPVPARRDSPSAGEGPATTYVQDNKDRSPGIYPLATGQGEWVSNPLPFMVDSLPECLAKKPCDCLQNAQAVSLPVIINGRIEQPDKWDVFRFEGHAGDDVVAEVYARRLGSPMDSALRLTDAAGKQLAYNDDHEDKAAALDTHHADSYLRVKLPADGAYYIHLADVQHQAGPECAYRLRISQPRPDFQLRVVPSSINVRGGMSVPLTVYALRRDGFSGPIELSLKDAPAGFVLGGGRLPADQDQVRVTLTAPPTPGKDLVRLGLEGRAKVQGRDVVRMAVPAEDMMQAFAYRHLVGAQELDVAVARRNPARAVMRVLGPMPIKIPAGKTASVRVGVPAAVPAGDFQLELDAPPEGISIQSVSALPMTTELVLKADAAKVKPGQAGNLIVNVFLIPKPPASAPASASKPASASAPAGKPAGNQRRVLLGSLPAIAYEISNP